jgi:hypothetical protein
MQAMVPGLSAAWVAWRYKIDVRKARIVQRLVDEAGTDILACIGAAVKGYSPLGEFSRAARPRRLDVGHEQALEELRGTGPSRGKRRARARFAFARTQ